MTSEEASGTDFPATTRQVHGRNQAPETDISVRVLSEEKLTFKGIEESKPAGKSGVSNLGAICNILTTAVGVGMLALPNAIAQAGFIPGFVMFSICIGIALLCCKLLQEAMWYAMEIQSGQDSGKEVRTYEDIGTIAFGTLGRVSVSLALHSSNWLYSQLP